MTATPDHLLLPDADQDPDHEFVDRLITLHPPRDADIVERMDTIRAAVLELAHLVVRVVPRSADRTVAIRAIHQAGQQAIGALACNQQMIPEETP